MNTAIKNVVSTGTTLIGLKCKQGVMLCSDRRASMRLGSYIQTHDMCKQKLIKMPSYDMAIACAGVAISSKYYPRIFTEYLLRYSSSVNKNISQLKTYPEILSYLEDFILSTYNEPAYSPFFNQLTFDVLNSSAFIGAIRTKNLACIVQYDGWMPFSIVGTTRGTSNVAPDSAKHNSEMPVFNSIGSGSTFAVPLLNSYNSESPFEELTFEKMYGILSKVMKEVFIMDVNSGGGYSEKSVSDTIDVTCVPNDFNIPIYTKEIRCN